MPRALESIDAIVAEAISTSILKIAPVIQRHVAQLAAEELERQLSVTTRGRGSHGTRRRLPTAALTKWTADTRARRVPKFVIEATGLDTKKKIVAKYGPNSAFEKGKSLPKTVK